MNDCKSSPTVKGLSLARLGSIGLVCLLATGGGVWPAILAAEIKPANEDKPAIAYRRVFVPADHVGSWPSEGEKYIPIEADEFDRAVKANNAAGSEKSPPASIDIAEYNGRLDLNGRLVGTGSWNISMHGTGPSYLSLDDPTLAFRDAAWAISRGQPARLGYWASSGHEAERLMLEVPASGVLTFKWSAAASTAHDTIEIPWHPPSAAATRLTLDLPEGRIPTIEGGMVLESKPTAPSVVDGKQQRRWVLAMPAGISATLRISSTEATLPSAARELTLHEDCSYRVEQNGVTISATWRLERLLDQLQEVRIPIPRGVQVESVQSDNRELAWHIERRGATSADIAVAALPEAGDGAPVQLVVRAWTPLMLDRPWRLPVLRPEGVFWSSGGLTLIIDEAFELRALTPVDCAQTRVRQVGAVATGPEIYSLAMFSPAATAEVTISRRQPDITVRTGSSLILADPDITGRLVSEWNVARSSVHRISGEIATGWNIEAVEAIPADAMAEWFIDRRGKQQRIDIQLTDAASPVRKVTIILMGRLQRFSLDAPISADTLRMVNWSAARELQHLLTFQSTEPFSVESVGELPTVARESITEADRALLEDVADDGQIVDLVGAGPNAGLQLAFKRGQYAADVELDALVTKSELRQTYRVTILPKGNPVDRLLVYSSAPLGNRVRWSERDSTLIADRVPLDDSQLKDLPKEGELWLVRLPQATAKEIQIQAEVESPWTKRVGVPLLSFPEAVEQRGEVVVRGNNASAPVVEQEQLSPTPIAWSECGDSRDDDTLPILASYRYHPAECIGADHTPKIWLALSTNSEALSLVVRRLSLQSFYWPDGRGLHRANFELDNCGATEFKPALAAGAKVLSITAGEQSLESVAAGDGKDVSSIRLPLQPRSATVSVCFTTQQTPLVAGRIVEAPLSKNGLSVFAGDWTVWLPEEFSARCENSSAGSEFDWRQRLFGPLAKPQGAPVFHPLRAADWARLVNSIAEWRGNSLPVGSEEPLRLPTAALLAPSTPVPNGMHSLAYALGRMARQGDLPAPLAGWQPFHFTFVAEGTPEPLTIFHPAATTAWSVASWLACFVACCWLLRKRALLTIGLLVLAASLALTLPTAFAPLAAAAMWGIAAAAVANCLRESRPRGAVVDLQRSRLAIAGILGCVVVIGVAAFANAEPTTDRVKELTGPPIEQVLIPVDPSRQPTGSKVFIGERFLRELFTTPAVSLPTNHNWLLRSAFYAGELTENRGESAISPGTWSLRFEIETLARDTTVTLPLSRDEAAWQSTAMLDGVPAPIEWAESGRSCSILVEQPGPYAVTIYGVPRSEVVDGRSQISLAIPPLLSAGIQLRAPDLLTGVTVANAVLSPPTKSSPGNISGELWSSDRLVVRWPRLEAKSGASQRLTVTEMNWVTVTEHGVELEAKYIVEGGARRPAQLAINYDNRWQLTGETSTSNQKTHRSDVHEVRTAQVVLPTGSSDRQEVVLRWKLSDVAAVGNVRLPSVELVTVPTTQRWFALSADSRVNCALLDNPATEATSKEFLTKWGSAASDSPKLVLANAKPVGDYAFSIRPQESDPTLREVLHIAAGSKALRLVYQASFNPGSKYRFQFPLSVPSDLVVERVELNSGDEPIDTRWTRDTDNQINVFFGDEVAADSRLTVSGYLPLQPSTRVQLPRISTGATMSTTEQVHLYRDDDVRVGLEGLPASEESNAHPSDLPPIEWMVRPLGVYHLDDTAAKSARVAVASEKHRLSGDTLTSLTRESDSWWAAIRCQLTVNEGSIDSLRLRIPDNWTGPFDVDSSVPVATSVLPRDERAHSLALRFASTITEGTTVDLRLRGPMTFSSGAAASVPEVRVEDLSAGRSFVMVPEYLETQRIAWSESGVRPAEIPKRLLPTSGGVARQRQLEVEKPAFRVAIHTESRPHAAPRIRLADTVIAIGERGNQLITTRLILTTDGLPACTLRLPADQQLVSITLDGHAALLNRQAENNWNVVLGSAQLPQFLEIVTRAAAAPQGALPDARRPMLSAGGAAIPVELSLWTLSQPKQATRNSIADVASVTAADLATLRFDRLLSIAESATAAAIDAPHPDGENWFRPWSALLRNVKNQARGALAQSATPSTVAQVSRSSEEPFARAAARLEAWLSQCAGLAAESNSAPASSLSDTAEQITGRPPFSEYQSTACYVVEGGADTLALSAGPAPASPLQMKILALTLVALIASVGVFLVRIPVLADFLGRWTYGVGILIGILYWAWLWPSWMGLAIAVASLWLSLRFNWPGRSIRPEASTVLRSTRGG